MKTKQLSEIIEEGWTEVFEFSKGQKSILYEKGNERMFYNTETNNIILEYKFEQEEYNEKTR